MFSYFNLLLTVGKINIYLSLSQVCNEINIIFYRKVLKLLKKVFYFCTKIEKYQQLLLIRLNIVQCINLNSCLLFTFVVLFCFCSMLYNILAFCLILQCHLYFVVTVYMIHSIQCLKSLTE